MDTLLAPMVLAIFVIILGVIYFYQQMRGDTVYVTGKGHQPSELVKRAEAYDLERVMTKLADATGQSNATRVTVDREFRRFLSVLAANTDQVFLLPDSLDEAWATLVREHAVYHGVTHSLLGPGGECQNHTMRNTTESERAQAIKRYTSAYMVLFDNAPPSSLFLSFDTTQTIGEQPMLQAKNGRHKKTFRKDGEKISTDYMPGIH